jgi:Raf kinase inhibitor-like YbhB/YbcL family protein
MVNSFRVGLGTLVLLAILSGCQEKPPEQPAQEETGVKIQIESDAFEAEGTIPQQYTCDGDDLSPPLTWSEPPVGTQSLALVCADPDAPAGTWDHWVLFNIPAGVRSLPEGISADPVVEGLGAHGSNGWGRLDYGGPCPPAGAAHHYLFQLYALDTNLDLDPGASRKDVEKGMKGHILAEGQLVGEYGR